MHFRSAAVPRGKLVPSPEGARNLERFEVIFLSPGKVQSENSDKLEFDDLLNETAIYVFEVPRVPK